MSLIEVQAPPAQEQSVPVTTREVFIKLTEDALEKASTPGQSPEVAQKHLDDAESFNRLANEPTTDEMRLEQFGTPLPENHVPAPGFSNKIGASALR